MLEISTTEKHDPRNEITLDKSEYIEDDIACITSTAEQIASFTLWTSACRSKRTM